MENDDKSAQQEHNKLSEQQPNLSDFGALSKQYNAAVSIIDDVVTKNYLASLTEMDVFEPDKNLFIENSKDSVRLFRIDEMVYNHDEYAADKFTSVFSALSTVENTVFMLIDSNGEKATFYLGVRSYDEQREARVQLDTLRSSLYGQFPGIKLSERGEYSNDKIVELMKSVKQGVISSVSCVANPRDENTRENKSFLQGLEKFALSMRGKQYTAVIMANSLSQDKLVEIRSIYEQLYTQLSPFSQQQLAYGTNTGWNYSVSNSHGTSKSITDTKGWSYTKGWSESRDEGISKTVSRDNTSKRVLKGLGAAVGVIGGVATAGLAMAGVGIPLAAMVGGGTSLAVGILSAAGDAIGEHIANSESSSHQNGTSASEAVSGGNTVQQGESDSHTENIGSSGETTKSITSTYQNKTVISLMERIDKQLKRLDGFESYGMWESAAYFISAEPNVSEIAACTYKAIISGDNTGIEMSAVNSWRPVDGNGGKSLKNIALYNYITNFMQPVFDYQSSIGKVNFGVTAGIFVSGRELALYIGLPRKSVCGFPVIEHADFGKEVVLYSGCENSRDFVLGKVFSMGTATNTEVRLDGDSLTMHTFITGSTGSGKSNAIYHLLDELCLQNSDRIHFLVVEPTKGEYKNVFGGRDGVNTFGTNSKVSKLLKLNPFSFPEEIHVLEHIDRLVEVFNACWPMYAAMPAILKAAVEEAYRQTGWNLTKSKNVSGKFPTFRSLIDILPEVIEESEYSKDTSSDYKGALVTRVTSLANGIYGQIFGKTEIPSEKLFDENTIVDLSRVGSSETKALIMGILVLKLQEYRMSKAQGSDSQLKHITVLEEAHCLLRRTSSEQSQESSNLQGKSVEMLANAIAEMRTYGEGFVIADQSPGLLDMSVIRNTNTKIILRLPDESDRMLVGKAAGLNDSQIEELAKLERGVAAVYQNNWLEPILCGVQHFKDDQYKPLNYEPEKEDTEAIVRFFETAFEAGNPKPLSKEDVDAVRNWIAEQPLPESVISFTDRFIENIKQGNKARESEKSYVAYVCFGGGGKNLGKLLKSNENQKIAEELNKRILLELDNANNTLVTIIRNLILTQVWIESSKIQNP